MCSIMFGFTHFSPKNVTLRLLYASSKKCFRSLYIGNRTQTQAFIYIYIYYIYKTDKNQRNTTSWHKSSQILG